MFMVLRRPRAARLVELKLSLAVCLACLVDNVLIPFAAMIIQWGKNKELH